MLGASLSPLEPVDQPRGLGVGLLLGVAAELDDQPAAAVRQQRRSSSASSCFLA